MSIISGAYRNAISANADAAAAAAQRIDALTFASVADMVAAATLTVGQKCRTLGYYAPGDGGNMDYEIVAAATATHDGGSYIDLAGVSGQARAGFNSGISAAHFGMVGDAVTDDIAAINAAVAYVKTIADAKGAARLTVPGNPAVSATVDLTFSDTVVKFEGVLTALAGFTPGAALLDITGSRTVAIKPTLECNKLAAGIDVSGGSIILWHPEAIRFKTYGVRLAGSSGDSVVIEPSITQWARTDAEFATDANFDAAGIYFNRADCSVIGGATRWCGICLHFGPGANTAWVRGHHPYNGRPSGDVGGPRIDPVIMQVDDGAAGVNIRDSYLDNGIVKLYSPSVSIRDCGWLVNDAAVTFTDQEVIQVFANGQTQPYQLDIETDSAGTLPLGYSLVAYKDEGVNSWSGDYSGLLSDDNLSISAINGEQITQHRIDNDIAVRDVFKPGGIITEKFTVGLGTAIRQEYAASGIKKQYAEEWRLHSLTGTPKLYFRDTANGITENGSGTVTICSGASPSVDFVTNGIVRPVADNSQSMGSASNRWSEVFAGTGTINTSDERLKTPLLELSEVEKAVAQEVKAALKKYKFLSAVENKGDAARIHFGIGAQTLKDIFTAHGLDANQYGLFCYNEWDDEYETVQTAAVLDDAGNLVEPAQTEQRVKIAAGNRYGVRYEELLCFVMASL